jgi:hypothetical protein
MAIFHAVIDPGAFPEVLGKKRGVAEYVIGVWLAALGIDVLIVVKSRRVAEQTVENFSPWQSLSEIAPAILRVSGFHYFGKPHNGVGYVQYPA